MVDNFEKIINLLDFRCEDDFYFLQIIQRKKDHKPKKVTGTNNNSRVVKSYYVRNIEHLKFIENEVKELSDLFNARASINLNRRSWKKTQLQTMKLILDHKLNNTFDKTHTAFDSACGKHSNEPNKKWILDIDGNYEMRNINQMIRFIEEECRPIGFKFIALLPSKNGIHVIMNPFDKSKFFEKYGVEIKKDNPTNLYIP